MQKIYCMFSVYCFFFLYVSTANAVSGTGVKQDVEAANHRSIKLSARVKVGAVKDSDRSLGQDAIGSSSTLFAALQPKLKAELSKQWAAFSFAEFLAANDVVGPSEDFASDQSGHYASLRELWFDYRGFSRYPGESIRLGLERLREPSALWWDREALLLRWNLNTTRWLATLGAAERIDLISTDDVELRLQDRERRRYFTGVDFQWRYNHWIGLKAMHSVDHADDVSRLSNDDLFERQFTWLGFSANRSYFRVSEDLPYQYTIDLLGLSGRAEHLVDGGGKRDIDVSGWALDVGVRKRINSVSPIFIGAHLAVASGDDDDTDNGTFYQTGLHTNRNRFTGTRSIVSRFGEAARLELSNIEVVSLYLSQRLGRWFEWSLMAHQFTRSNENQSVQLDGLSVNPADGENSIGSEVDLLLAYYNPKKRGPLSKFSSKFRAGYFDAGDAYSHLPDNGRYRLSFSLEKQF